MAVKKLLENAMPTRRQMLQVLLLLPMGVLFACGSPPKVTKLPKGSKVVALGDSLTFGYGADKGHGYPDVLATLTGWQIDNLGVNGDTTDNVLARLEMAIQKKPQLVLLGIGGNDVLRRVNKDVSYNNLRQIVAKLQNAKIDVVLIAQPHFSASALFGRASDNPMYQAIADETGVLLFADGWSKILSDDKLKSDQIHANNMGYEKFAHMLFEFLQSVGYV